MIWNPNLLWFASDKVGKAVDPAESSFHLLVWWLHVRVRRTETSVDRGFLIRIENFKISFWFFHLREEDKKIAADEL